MSVKEVNKNLIFEDGLATLKGEVVYAYKQHLYAKVLASELQALYNLDFITFHVVEAIIPKGTPYYANIAEIVAPIIKL